MVHHRTKPKCGPQEGLYAVEVGKAAGTDMTLHRGLEKHLTGIQTETTKYGIFL